MEQITSRKLEEASIHMDGSSEHLFNHLKDGSKSCSGTCSKKACILGSALCLLFVVSTAALLMSAAALWSMQARRVGTGMQTTFEQDHSNSESEALDQLVNEEEAQFIHGRIPSEEASFENVENRDMERRNAELESNFCVSSSNQTDAKPLAHIVGEGKNNFRKTPKVRGRGTYSVITGNWQCNSESQNQGNVQGGMIFDKSSGTLQLPTAGMYYIYYQITFRQFVSNRNRETIHCRVVGCRPDQKCNFNTPRTDYSYMQSEFELGEANVNSLSQGGLFYFPAGSKITVIANQAGSRSPQLLYDDNPLLTYFGAFLVNADQ